MISVGSSDGRKGLGLGLGFDIGGEMEETEVEEGEACYYQSDDNSAIDPDVTLSYIDEKLQDVLGHFQKDFEGGVSAENLGSKFGGYGSFLPTYQRSPVGSHQRTPPKVHNHITSRSPSYLNLEDGHHNSVVTSIASLSSRSVPASKSSVVLPPLKASSVAAEEFNSAHELVSEKSAANRSDQKTLKVRIKVGSDNLSTREKAEIYSGLGLDASSSLENSPTDSKGLWRESHAVSHDSPISILQVMTPFPVLGSSLLSPLSNGSFHLVEKERLSGESRFGVHKRSQDILKEKNQKKSEKYYASVKFENNNVNDCQNGSDVLPQRKTEIDTSTCEELVSNALRLPLLSNSDSGIFKSAKGGSKKGKAKDKRASDLANEEPPLETLFNRNGEKPEFPENADSSISQGRNALHAEPNDPIKQKTGKKSTSHEEDDMKMVPEKEQPASGGKMKSKARSNGTEFLSLPKSRKSTNVNSHVSNREVETLTIDYGKAKDRYNDFFGDLELEQENTGKVSEKISLDDGLKDSEVVEKKNLGHDSVEKEKVNAKKIEKVSFSEAYPRVASVVPLTENGPSISNVPGTAAATVKEDWVCCDKCQKWRLLPHGTNPDSLPEKWQCSMLDWLPGMNRCIFTEEEITKALTSRYQVLVPAPEGQTTQQQGHRIGTLSGVSSVQAMHFDEKAGEKKKQISKDVSEVTNLEDPMQISASMKKNLQASIKSKSLNGVNQSPAVNEVDFQHSGQSSSLISEKQRHKRKEKNKLQSYSGGGDTVNLKTKIKRESDQDSFKSSKKLKHDTDNDGTVNGGTLLKVGHSTSSDLSMNLIGNTKRDCKIAGMTNDSESVKKRKGNDMSFTSPGNHLLASRDLTEKINDNHQNREKKARAMKENSTSKGSSRSDRKVRSTKDEQLGSDPGSNLNYRSLDVTDPLKKDLQFLQPSLAATSSSSKVSGSRKTKAAKHQEMMKGSPVESVSSSPLRVSNPDKFTTNLRANDVYQEAAIFTTGSPRKCFDDEDGGGSDRLGIVRKSATFTGTHRESLESSVLDFGDRVLGPASSAKTKTEVVPEEKGTTNQHHASGERSRKSGKGSSSRSKDKSRSLSSEPESLIEPVNHTGYDEKSDVERNKFNDKVERNIVPTGKGVGENGKRESQSKIGRHSGPDVRAEAISSQDAKQNQVSESDGERSSKRFPSEKQEFSGRVKSHSLPPSGRGPHPVSGYQKENGANILASDTRESADASKTSRQIKKAENQNEDQSNNSRHPTPNGKRIRDVAPSPARRDSSSQAATTAIKEAKDLKHLADRLKNTGSNSESTGLYFQAALKFLHGASLLESSSGENSKHGEMIQSIQIYSSTAKLCEFCAHEYEKCKDMAAAALAYKCTEVAYMRVIYSSHGNAGRDRHELQTALQMVPLGESPSSSASDIDRLNNPTTMDRAPLPRGGVTSPQVTGNCIIAARNRSNFVRLLSFAQDVNFAMEASRRSRMAFEAATSSKKEEAAYSVKRALDFSFNDVDGLLRLVRVAMEAMNR